MVKAKKEAKMTGQLEIVYLDINEVNPSAYNPREISDNAFEGLKESIKKFGFVDPLVINKRTGVLCGGHFFAQQTIGKSSQKNYIGMVLNDKQLHSALPRICQHPDNEAHI